MEASRSPSRKHGFLRTLLVGPWNLRLLRPGELRTRQYLSLRIRPEPKEYG